MAATYEPIATTTVSDSASFTFSNIPATYTDLVLIMNYRNTKVIDNYSYPQLVFNSDTNTNYSQISLYGNGSSVSSAFQSNRSSINTYEGAGDLASAGVYGLIVVNIMNYSNTTTYKTVSIMGGTPLSSTIASTQVGLWRNTSAITSITISDGSQQIKSGSSFTLYGIKAA